MDTKAKENSSFDSAREVGRRESEIEDKRATSKKVTENMILSTQLASWRERRASQKMRKKNHSAQLASRNEGRNI